MIHNPFDDPFRIHFVYEGDPESCFGSSTRRGSMDSTWLPPVARVQRLGQLPGPRLLPRGGAPSRRSARPGGRLQKCPKAFKVFLTKNGAQLNGALLKDAHHQKHSLAWDPTTRRWFGAISHLTPWGDGSWRSTQ